MAARKKSNFMPMGEKEFTSEELTTADAIIEAADAGIKLIVTITEGIPVSDMVKVKQYLYGKPLNKSFAEHE